jgi:hypothetical protein
VQLRRRAFARLLENRLQVNAALCGDRGLAMKVSVVLASLATVIRRAPDPLACAVCS